MCARTKRKRFPSNLKLDSEINVPFLLNEHSDPLFVSMKIIFSILSSNLWLFFGKWNIYYRGRHNKPNSACTNYVPLIKRIKNAGYLKTFFLGHRWINEQRKSNSVWYNMLHWKLIEFICYVRYARSPLVDNHICQHCGMKTSTLSCNNSIPSFLGNLWQVLILGNHLKICTHKTINKTYITDRCFKKKIVFKRWNSATCYIKFYDLKQLFFHII